MRDWKKNMDEAVQSGKDLWPAARDLWNNPSMEQAVKSARAALKAGRYVYDPTESPTYWPERYVLRRFFGFNLLGDAGEVAGTPPEDAEP